MKRRTFFVSAGITLAAPSIVGAQAWPANPIRLIHGYDAGSNPDTIARHLAPALTEILGVQIVIEAKPGAAERLAATQVARMKPDGSVLYLMTGGQAVVSATDKTLSYDLLRDRLVEALRETMARPAVKDKLEELGNDTRIGPPAEFRTRVEQDLARWRPLAHVVGQS